MQKPLQADLIKQLDQLKLANSPNQAQSADFDVRFFEEQDGKRTELPDDGSFEQSLSGMDASGLKETLSQMKGALGSQEEREAFEEVMSQLGGGWDNMRTVGDIEKMLSGQDSYTASIDAEIEKTVAQLPEEMHEGLYEQFANGCHSPKTANSSHEPPPPRYLRSPGP